MQYRKSHILIIRRFIKEIQRLIFLSWIGKTKPGITKVVIEDSQTCLGEMINQFLCFWWEIIMIGTFSIARNPISHLCVQLEWFRLRGRNAAHEWCLSRNHSSLPSLFTLETHGWGTGDQSIRFDKGHSPSYCYDPRTGDSIASLHIFGSGETTTVRNSLHALCRAKWFDDLPNLGRANQ